MARDAVTITALTLDGGKDLTAGTTISHDNGASLAIAGDTNRLLIYVTNTESAEYDVTVVAGTAQEAIRGSLGNLVYPVGAGEAAFIVVESARFAQAAGAIHVDFEDGMAGKIHAYRLPEGS